MKISTINNVIFDPAAKTIDTGIIDFDIRRLYAIINQTTGTLIYATATPDKTFTGVSGSVVTLQFDTTAMSSTDILQVLYDDSEDMELSRMLYEIVERLAFLPSVQGTLADLRVSVVNTPAVTVSTITTLTTLANQTSIGGYLANPQIPALMNAEAQANINNLQIT